MEPKPRSNRICSSVATGKYSKCRLLETKKTGFESSSSTGTKKLVRAANTKKEFQNTWISNHQYLKKVFQHLQKKLGLTTGHSTFATDEKKTNTLILEMFHVIVNESSHASWTKLYRELGSVQEYEFLSHRNWY